MPLGGAAGAGLVAITSRQQYSTNIKFLFHMNASNSTTLCADAVHARPIVTPGLTKRPLSLIENDDVLDYDPRMWSVEHPPQSEDVPGGAGQIRSVRSGKAGYRGSGQGSWWAFGTGAHGR